MYHIRELRLMVFFDFADLVKQALVCPLVCALEEAAPILQILDIYIGRSPWLRPAEIYLQDVLFAHSAPVLRYVRLDGITLRSRAYEALSTTQILDLCQPEINLVRVLNFYPRLEQLRIDTGSLFSNRRKIHTHNLRLLDLPGTIAVTEIVLNRLILTRPLAVWMEDVGDDAITYIISNVP